MRLTLIALFALLVIPFAGCGDKPADDGGNNADTNAEKPAEGNGETPAADPKPAASAEGAASPDELIAQLKKTMDANDMAGMVPLVLEEQRGLLALAMGMLAPAMTIGMGKAMAEMAGGGDPEKVAEAKAKFTKLEEGYKAILEKHGLDSDMDGVMGQMQSMQSDPDAAIKATNEMFKDVDHEAFIRDSMAFMKESGEDKGSMGPSKDDVKLEDVKIDVKGDTAVATAKGKDDPLTLVKRDGRWYIDFKTMMPSGR